MKHVLLMLSFCCLFAGWSIAGDGRPEYVLVVHGGAGSMSRQHLRKEVELLYRQGLQHALDAGEEVLKNGGSAVDAVQAAIMVLEDDSMFNAGRGAVFAANGMNELDASIMDGSDLNAGAVAGVTTIRNPILAARMVMDKSEHVMLARKGAEMFAEKNGCEIVKPSYFRTKRSRAAFERNRKNRNKKSMLGQPANTDEKYGTVGAVALDIHGNLAAGTSTGGMSGKRFARIGDSPVIGAGTYADNNSCAVSCTGWGEYFIRLAMAKAICDRVELQGLSLVDATKLMIHRKLQDMGATGGVIAVDKNGNISIEFNTTGMNRAWLKSDGERGVALFKDEGR